MRERALDVVAFAASGAWIALCCLSLFTPYWTIGLIAVVAPVPIAGTITYLRDGTFLWY